MKKFKAIFDNLDIKVTLVSAWIKFKKGKTRRTDIKQFGGNVDHNLKAIAESLVQKTYRHDSYKAFTILDPKLRQIHKATVKDRVVHQFVFDILNPIFEPTFIFDSYSCRIGKGTHKGIERLTTIARRVSANNTKPCFILKCDIRKFFASVDHAILLQLIKRKIEDDKIIWLVERIIRSRSPGLPLGNLTSQLFGNIYMNELDWFIKHRLRIPFYIRYTDDFVIVCNSREQLTIWLEKIRDFLRLRLKLELHPNKVTIRKYHWGIDFLGYIQHPTYRLLRAKIKKRIFRKIIKGVTEPALQSYLGVLGHANAKALENELKNLFWFNHLE